MIPCAISQCLRRYRPQTTIWRRPMIDASNLTAKRALALAPILICAGFLANCAASLNGESASDLSLKQQAAVEAVASTEPAPDAAPARAARTAEAFTSVATPGSSAYKIGPLDVLDVSVFKVPELSKTVQVADAGTVNLPLVGEIPAAGRTAQEVERDLTKQLGAKYLKSPQVTVFVKEYNSQRVTIEGAVKKQGVYPIRGRTTLLQFIAMADGLDSVSDSTVLVFRQTDGGRMAARFDIDAIRSGTAEDPVIYSGDVIVANSSMLKGAFNNVLKMLPLAGTFMLLM